MQRWRVPLGFACAGLFLLLAKPMPLTLAAGGAVALAGLALRAWASGHIRKNARLAVSGPYAYTRNPLYLGSLVLGLGFHRRVVGRVEIRSARLALRVALPGHLPAGDAR